MFLNHILLFIILILALQSYTLLAFITRSFINGLRLLGLLLQELYTALAHLYHFVTINSTIRDLRHATTDMAARAAAWTWHWVRELLILPDGLVCWVFGKERPDGSGGDEPPVHPGAEVKIQCSGHTGGGRCNRKRTVPSTQAGGLFYCFQHCHEYGSAGF